MKLVRTTIFSAIITFIRIASGFVAGKAVAIFTGPAGVALVGAFTNFITIVLTFANGAINTGVVKYTSEYTDDEERLKQLFSTSLTISVCCSVIFGLVIAITAPYLSNWVFASNLYTSPVRVLGLTIILYSLNSLLISILNGKGQIKTYTIVNTLGSFIGLIFTVVLVFYYKIEGALYALVLSQSIVFFVTALMVIRSPWFSWGYFNKGFNRVLAIKLSHYSLMAVISALTVPLSQIILRNMVISKLGVDEAGYWQGLMRISDGYLMLITTSLSTYYLPKLSSLKTDFEIKNEVLNGYKIILPAVFAGCLIIYLFRFFIIEILFTPTFSSMEALFFWQLIGDFFKMVAWILAYLMLAKSMTKMYIFTEIFFSASYIVFGYVFIHFFQVKGVVIAFAVNYFIYMIVMLVIFRNIFKSNHK